MVGLEVLIKGVKVEKIVGKSEGVRLKGLEVDSRKVERDFAFLCIKGETVDAHDFIDDVIEKGATVIICEEIPEVVERNVVYVQVANTQKLEGVLAVNFYGNPSASMNIFGVTGTNGKTTTAKMVHELLKIMGVKSGYSGTVGIEYNDVLEESKNTTGTPIVVQRMLSRMLKEGIKDVAIEVSSHALVLGRLQGVDISVAGFTNLTQDHLDFHKTFEEYEDAKAKLFTEFVDSELKMSVVNVDDEVGVRYKQLGKSEKITYSLKDNKADLYAYDVELNSMGTKFKIKFADKIYAVETNLVGEFNVYNSLCAIGVLLTKGYAMKEILWAISQFRTVSGRMEFVENKNNRAIYVDYAHTPDGIENVLKSINKFKKGKSIVVFGCGGDRDRTKRPIMAKIAEKYADEIYVTSDNPRTEEPHEIIKDVLGGFEKPMNVYVLEDRKEAILKAYGNMGEDDVLVVAGKGHENYQIIGKNKYYFSDVDVIKQA